MQAHPLVREVDRTDRGVYEWTTTGNPTQEDMAALVLTGLAAAQAQALRLARANRAAS